MDQAKATYFEEASELLSELESALLELEESPADKELIGRIFRAMHTIKGSGAMFGFDELAAFTHEVETVYDQVRSDRLQVTRELVDLTLAARDQIRSIIDAAAGGQAADPEISSRIIASLRGMLSGAACLPPEPAAPARPPDIEPQHTAPVTYRIRFKPSENIFRTGMNPLNIIHELQQFGEHRVIAHTTHIPDLDALDAEKCYTTWDIILTTVMGYAAIRDVFIFVEDDSEISIELIDNFDEFGGYKKLGEILVDKGDLTEEELRNALGSQKRIGEVLVEAGVVQEGRVEAALAEQEHVRQMREKRDKSEAAASIRVASEKLDYLANLVGELVTVQARLRQAAGEKQYRKSVFRSISEEVERLTWELRDQTMNIRMLPIGTTFSKFKRLVRDLSRDLGKEIELTTAGAETELDKTVIDKLNDPLIHLIRNSIDHGIETPDVREKCGKPAAGRVHLSAEHSGAHVLIEITDDGRGLDARAIRAKAIEKGMLIQDAQPTEKELFALILAPGFSTAKSITNVSGRGVGMDVVKKSIDDLRGTIDIASRSGQGSTITLKLPLTLAIIDGLLVRIGEGFYILSLSAVEECIELNRKDIEEAHGRHMTNVRGRRVPYIRLRNIFSVNGKMPLREQVVIVETTGGRIGLVVDQVIGEHQTVLKSLGRFYRGIEGISGATILGDGNVALILDIPELVRAAEARELLGCMQNDHLTKNSYAGQAGG